MASSYAALVSLMNVLNRVQHPTCSVTFDNGSQLKALFDRVSFLVDFLETHSQYISKDLQGGITDAAYAAQDAIESYVVFVIFVNHEWKTGKKPPPEILASRGNGFLHQDLEKAIQGLDLVIHESREVEHKRDERPAATSRGDVIIQEVTEVKHKRDERPATPTRVDVIIQDATEVTQEKDERPAQQPRSTANVVASVLPPTGTIEILGFRDDLNLLLERLASQKSSRETVPVVGMGGIGKSTLASSVYSHSYVRDTFDFKAWVTISQVYDIETIIHHLLHDFGIDDLEDTQLGDQLHKYLFGRKYLVVLDDIWDSQAWEGISRFLPDNNNGSRILLTTRLSNVALSVGSCSPYEMKLLDDDRSWDLLSKMVFGQDVCPPELETCGKKIARGCKGLPLSVVVIVGVLKMSNNTLETWEDVAENISSIISRGDDDHCLRILSLSYQELPIYLKPCFLYMATFPEDYEIRVSEVVMLWTADGFLKPHGDDTLEEAALKYLNDLVMRNLIFVKKRDSTGSMKCLVLHDMVRCVSIREARKEMFLYVGDDGLINFPEAIESHRRLAHHGSNDFFSPRMQLKGLARSFVWLWKWGLPPDVSQLFLLRVFVSSYLDNPLEDIRKLVNVRLLKFTTSNLEPEESFQNRLTTWLLWASWMWNLETLIVDVRDSNLKAIPDEIWSLQRIKHLIFSGKEVKLPAPPVFTDDRLQNLQTLKHVRVWSKRVLYMIPNIKDLGIKCDYELEPLDWYFVHYHNLEMLNLEGRIRLPPNDMNTVKWFPDRLRKLTLSRCYIPSERMTVVGSLLNLEVLKLKWDSFIGEEWNTTEGEFQKLKVLSIVDWSTLLAWRVDNKSHFPCLEHLSLCWTQKLKEVPEVFGESMTLKSVQLRNCGDSVLTSAKQVLDEQESTGNYDFTVQVVFTYLLKEEQKTELASLASERFHMQFK